MSKRKTGALAFALLALSLDSVAHAQTAFTIDVHDPNTGARAAFTRVIGLNAQGDICGGALLNGVRLAFTGSRQADFTDLQTFSYPGAIFTQCRGINAAGQLVGVYQSSDAKNHAFVKIGPDFISIDAPPPDAVDTRGFGIDPFGQIVGRYTTRALVDGKPKDTVHGFFLNRDGGFFTINVPGAVATEASEITPLGDITGIYLTETIENGLKVQRVHGYILSNNVFTTIDVPGAANTGTPTGGVWMSTSGELAGYYQPQGSPAGQFRAWLRALDGTFSSYLVPGATDTCFFNINERGDFVGRYVAGGVEHGVYIERVGRRPLGQ
jgi:hypothetical protein